MIKKSLSLCDSWFISKETHIQGYRKRLGRPENKQVITKTGEGEQTVKIRENIKLIWE